MAREERMKFALDDAIIEMILVGALASIAASILSYEPAFAFIEGSFYGFFSYALLVHFANNYGKVEQFTWLAALGAVALPIFYVIIAIAFVVGAYAQVAKIPEHKGSRSIGGPA